MSTAATAIDGEARERLRASLQALGFDAVRFAATDVLPANNLREWLAAGHHADMAWIERGADKRLAPELVLSGVKTVILLGVNYASRDPRWSEGAGGVWARYALHRDYHDTIQPALVAAGQLLEREHGATSQDYRYYVDTGPVLERNWAAKAGLGFTGRNAMLISREFGNWLFLAAILWRGNVAPDEPLLPERRGAERRETGLLCGKCTRCLDACPTDAFTAPGIVDARRCISYHTIENRGFIPRELRGAFGMRVYGCDVCAEVCPWNRFAQEAKATLLERRFDLTELTLLDLLRLTPERFREVFRGTAIKRTKLTGLLRNACIAAGNAWRKKEAESGERGVETSIERPIALPATSDRRSHERPRVEESPATSTEPSDHSLALVATSDSASTRFAPTSDRDSGITALARLAEHESPVVRGHAVWALREILGRDSAEFATHLDLIRARETDPTVLAEYAGSDV